MSFKALITFESGLESPNLMLFDYDIFWEVKVEIRFCIVPSTICTLFILKN
eukprot:UN22680